MPLYRFCDASPPLGRKVGPPGAFPGCPGKGPALQKGACLFQLADLTVNLRQDLEESHGSSIRSCQVVVHPGFAKQERIG